MEYFELLNEDGSKTGEVKERSAVHRDGDLHGGSHVWVIGESREDGSFDVLIQKRSDDKDAYPGCYDTSCAGHVAAGEDFMSAALRELSEELGIEAEKEELIYLFSLRTSLEANFHGKPFVNREVNFVYLLNRVVKPCDVTFQREEIQAVAWENSNDLIERLKNRDKRYCAKLGEFERVAEYVKNMRSKV